jgi:hypothetical protein
MNKKLQFTVTVEFSDKITDDKEILEVADNIARAIAVETNGLGISPQDADAYTISVAVKPQYLDSVVNATIIS